MSPSVRPARLDDLRGVVRRVAEMYGDIGEEYSGVRPPADAPWQRAAESALAERLGHDVMAFVIDHPTAQGEIAAVAVGRLHQTLPSPRRTGSLAGYIDWVATDPSLRRRGLARAVVSQLVSWFDAQGAGVIDLHATAAAAPLYRQMGFGDDGPVSLRRKTG